MPNIRQLQAKDVTIQPSDAGPSAAANTARRIAGVYGDIVSMQAGGNRGWGDIVRTGGAEIVRYAENREISQGGATFAEMQASLSQLWNEHAHSADENDAETAVRFQKEVMDPALEKWGNSFMTEGGQKFARGRVDSLRRHMFEKTRSDMVTLAGEAAQVNMRVMGNQLSAMVRADPTSLDMALETLNTTIDAQFAASPNLVGPRANAAKIQIAQKMSEDIVKSAVLGAIGRNPDEGMRLAQDPRYSKFITGAEVGQFEREVRQQKRLEQAERRLQEQEAREAKRQRSEEVTKAFIDALADPTKEVKIEDIRKAKDDLSLTHFEHLLNVVDRRGKPDPLARVSAETASDFFQRMMLPEGDPERLTTFDEIAKAFGDGKLSRADYKFLREEQDRMNNPEFSRTSVKLKQLTDAVKVMFDKPSPLVPITDPEGRLKLLQFQKQVAAEMQAARAAGKNPEDVLDSYLGPDMLKKLAPWQSSLQEVMQRNMQTLTRGSGGSAVAPSRPLPPGAPDGAFWGDDNKLYRRRPDGSIVVLTPRAAPPTSR